MFGNDYNINPEIDLNSNKSLMRLMFAGPVKKKKDYSLAQSSSATK